MNASGFHQQSGTIKLNCDDWATKGIPQMTLSNYANSHSELCHVEFHQWRCFVVKNNSWGKHKSGFLKRFNWKSNTHSLEKKILFNLIYSGILQKVQILIKWLFVVRYIYHSIKDKNEKRTSLKHEKTETKNIPLTNSCGVKNLGCNPIFYSQEISLGFNLWLSKDIHLID